MNVIATPHPTWLTYDISSVTSLMYQHERCCPTPRPHEHMKIGSGCHPVSMGYLAHRMISPINRHKNGTQMGCLPTTVPGLWPQRRGLRVPAKLCQILGIEPAVISSGGKNERLPWRPWWFKSDFQCLDGRITPAPVGKTHPLSKSQKMLDDGAGILPSDPTQQFQGNQMHWSTCKVGKRLHRSLGVLWWEKMHWRIKQLLETMIQIEWVNCLSSPWFAWFFARYPYHYSSLNGCLNYQADIYKHI